MKKIFETNKLILWQTCFEEFSSTLSRLNQINEKIIIGLSGGTSLTGFYNYIIQNKQQISKDIWSQIIFTFLDERLVPLDDLESNYKNLYENLFKDLLDTGYISDSQIIKIDIKNPDFLNKINEQVKSIDIALLGVGPDGHVCSLFPHHPGLDDISKGYITINNSPKPPDKRITISKDFLQSINNIFIFFIGESKRQALNDFIDGNNTNNCPARLVAKAPNLYLISDLYN